MNIGLVTVEPAGEHVRIAVEDPCACFEADDLLTPEDARALAYALIAASLEAAKPMHPIKLFLESL